MIEALIVFVALFTVDVCWAFYINCVKDGSAFKSATWATFMFGVGAIGTISYVTNPWLLIPALAGAFCGTYVGVYLNKEKNETVS